MLLPARLPGLLPDRPGPSTIGRPGSSRQPLAVLPAAASGGTPLGEGSGEAETEPGRFLPPPNPNQLLLFLVLPSPALLLPCSSDAASDGPAGLPLLGVRWNMPKKLLCLLCCLPPCCAPAAAVTAVPLAVGGFRACSAARVLGRSGLVLPGAAAGAVPLGPLCAAAAAAVSLLPLPAPASAAAGCSVSTLGPRPLPLLRLRLMLPACRAVALLGEVPGEAPLTALSLRRAGGPGVVRKRATSG